MAKRPTTDTLLARLRTLRQNPADPALPQTLHEILTARLTHGIVLKLAAALARDSGDRSLAPALAAAIHHFLGPDAAKTDPGCEGKTEAAKILIEWEAEALDPFLDLATYRQPEPIFGGDHGPFSKDTAAELRGLAAIAIARLRPENAPLLLADLLADPEPLTRTNAAIALGLWRGPEAAALLRLKARVGDDSPDVLTEVLAALLRHGPRDHLSLIIEFLESAEQNSIEPAALALGSSTLAEALPPLIAAHARHRRSPVGTTLLMAIALLRVDAALTYLLSLLPKASEREALNILDALAIHKSNPHLRAQLAALAKEHPGLASSIREIFAL
jgi:hypothetical protein